jgi:hypothetical protein
MKGLLRISRMDERYMFPVTCYWLQVIGNLQ